jgi:hypothetical protein
MDPGTLFAGVIFGCIGLAAWQIGRKQQSGRQMLLGFALMGFPYVTPAGWPTWAVGALLTVLVFWP